MFDKQKTGRDEPSTTESQSNYTPASSSSARSTGTGAAIGKTIVIKGDVSGDEDLKIEGKVEGSINLHSHELEVGESGVVTANINAKAVRIDGQVDGDIEGSDVVTIARSGNVRGNITAPRVTLEDGAKFKGSIDMDPAGGGATKVTHKTQEKAQRVVADQASSASSANVSNA